MTTERQILKQQLVAGLVGVVLLTAVSVWLYIIGLQDQLLYTESQWLSSQQEVAAIRGVLLSKTVALEEERTANQITAPLLLTIHRAIDPEVAEIIVREAVKQGISYHIHPLLVLALIKVESGFDPMAVSRAGAIGLMQIMKKHHPEKVSDEDLFHIGINIRVGCQIISEYLVACNSNLPLALHRYLGRKAKGKELVDYQMAVLKTFFELVIAHETLRQNYLNG